MPFIAPEKDRLKLAYTYTLGLQGHTIPPPQSSFLQPVATSFVDNFTRLKRLMLVPAFIGDIAGRVQRYTDVAEHEITGTILNARNATDEHGAKIFDRMTELLADDTKRVTTGDAASVEAAVKDAIETGGSYAVLLSASQPGAHFETLLSAYITSMWTVFETLAGDLWEAAINEKPNLLAQLKGKPSRLRKGRPATPDISVNADEPSQKVIKLDVLQFHHWNLTNKMGTALKTRYTFSRLEGIREAYAAAFCEKTDDLDKALTDVALDILSALRNVIAHKAGIADREYLDRCKTFDGLPRATEGHSIELDGKMTAHMIGEAAFCCAVLIRNVDEWLSVHR
jgi:hypothetical protein